MKRPIFSFRSYQLLLFLLLLSIHFRISAQEVVTPSYKQWAKEALENESVLSAPVDSRTLAVLYFQNSTDNSALNPLQKGMTYMLITDLSKLNQINLVERVRLQALLQEMNLSSANLLDPLHKPILGKLLKVQYIVGGELLSSDHNGFKVESDLIDIPSDATLGTPTSMGTIEELIRVEKVLLFKIIKLLRIELSREEVDELNRPLSENLDALLAFFNGLEESDSGNYEKAGEFYTTALTEDPNLRCARQALKELKDRQLISGRSKSHMLLYSLQQRVSITQSLSPSRTEVKRVPIYSSQSTVVIGW